MIKELDASHGITTHLSGHSIASEALARFPALRHASTTRTYTTPGVSRLNELLGMRQHLGAPGSFVAYGEQLHTSSIGVVTDEIVAGHGQTGHWRFPCTDALVTRLRNVMLCIQTADCAPVFLFDPANHVLGLSHAGWRGTLDRIVAKTVAAMGAVGSRPADIVAWVGPMAGGCCYEVGQELVDKFTSEFNDLGTAGIVRGRNLDLVQANCLQLMQAGLHRESIHRSNVCTIHNSDRFYSYRADNGTHGRIISAMVLQETD